MADLEFTAQFSDAFDALPAPVHEPSAGILRLDSGFESSGSEGGFSFSIGGFGFGFGGGSSGGGEGGGPSGGEGGGGPAPAP